MPSESVCLKDAFLAYSGNSVKMTPLNWQVRFHLDAKIFPTDVVLFRAHPGRLDSLRPTDNNRRVARCFLAAVLLLSVYLTGRKASPNRISHTHGNNSSAVMFFTMKWHYFSLSVSALGHSEWARIAVRISFAASLSCALGKSVHVSIVCRAAGVVLKLYCSTHQRVRLLSVTLVFIWLVLKPLFYNKNVKLLSEGLLLGCDTLESSGGSWTFLTQMQPLAILCYASVSVLRSLRSPLTKLNVLNVHLNVQLLTCLRATQAHTMYVLFIKFIMLM